MTELDAVHNVLLTILREIKRICDKYDIRFYLGYGSLLGAIRHQGFIPWDDDGDVVMMREDFERFQAAALKELKEPFFLQTEKNAPEIIYSGIARLRHSGTTGVQQGRDVLKKVNHGIAVDILALDRFPAGKRQRERALARADFYLIMQYIKSNIEDVKTVKRFHLGRGRTWCCKWIARWGPYSYWHKKMEELIKRQNLIQDYLFVVTHNRLGDYRDYVYDKKWFEEILEVPFEGLKFPVPCGYENILSIIYGDGFMDIPPENQRKKRHSGIINPYVPYDVYLKHFTDIYVHGAHKTQIVFGAGHMLEYYMKHEGKKNRPEYIVDNNETKWGTKVYGIDVKNPEIIKSETKGTYQVIICSIYYREIECQLMDMGIEDYYFYIQNKNWL